MCVRNGSGLACCGPWKVVRIGSGRTIVLEFLAAATMRGQQLQQSLLLLLLHRHHQHRHQTIAKLPDHPESESLLSSPPSHNLLSLPPLFPSFSLVIPISFVLFLPSTYRLAASLHRNSTNCWKLICICSPAMCQLDEENEDEEGELESRGGRGRGGRNTLTRRMRSLYALPDPDARTTTMKRFLEMAGLKAGGRRGGYLQSLKAPQRWEKARKVIRRSAGEGLRARTNFAPSPSSGGGGRDE
eukprot:757245-Hanusia_phi.AAC.1